MIFTYTTAFLSCFLKWKKELTTKKANSASARPFLVIYFELLMTADSHIKNQSSNNFFLSDRNGGRLKVSHTQKTKALITWNKGSKRNCFGKGHR